MPFSALKRFFDCLVLVLVSSCFVQAEPPALTSHSYTLDQCYQMALQTSEQLKLKTEEIKIAQGEYRQAIAAIYPNISANAQQNIRDNSDFGRVVQPGGSSIEDPASNTGGRAGSIGRTQFETSLSVSQPIFNGFRDYLYAKAFESETAARKLDRERSMEQLYQDVAELYNQILLFEEQVLIYKSSEHTLLSRITELNKFISLGKSRDSEVLAAQSELEALKVTHEQTNGALNSARELLAFLIGVSANTLRLDPKLAPNSLLALDNYLALLADRKDFKANRLRVASQQNRLTAVDRERWPSLNLNGATYPFEDPERNRDWELMVRMSIPIFEGGRISAEAATEQARLRQAEITAQEQQRRGQRDVRVAYAKATSILKQIENLTALVKTSEQNHSVQRKDYELGVVSNLEVLQALRQVLDAKNRLASSKRELATQQAILLVISGGVSR